MESQSAKRGQDAANAGIEALKQNRRDEAGMHFNRALDHYEEIEDMAERRSELGTFALLLDRVGFPDLALMTAQEAVELDKQLGDQRHLAEDIVTCGNAELHMGNTDDALSHYSRALDVCVANGDLDNAASTSTNIALIIGNRGEMNKAIRMMYESLDYLAQQPNPATEIITRIALSQALEAEGRPPEDIFAVARPIVRFADKLRPDQWDGLRGPLEDTVQRYVQLHPEANSLAVKNDYLTGLF